MSYRQAYSAYDPAVPLRLCVRGNAAACTRHKSTDCTVNNVRHVTTRRDIRINCTASAAAAAVVVPIAVVVRNKAHRHDPSVRAERQADTII